MNKNAALTLLIALGISAAPIPLLAEVESLRGNVALDDDSRAHDFKKWSHDSRPIDRGFVQQPPLIPHEVARYRIDRNNNKCLSCHSWENYREARATKISLTHFRDRDGVELSNVSASRYFCNQCHVPQADAPPLIGNDFQPVDALSGR